MVFVLIIVVIVKLNRQSRFCKEATCLVFRLLPNVTALKVVSVYL